LVLAPGGGLLRAGSLIREIPSTGSLLPLDADTFRVQYGQEAIFRLRLGVDAALAPSQAADAAPPSACPAPDWQTSAERRQYSAALEQRRYYEAGQALGRWQRHQTFCHLR
jgi:hypothetical protein